MKKLLTLIAILSISVAMFGQKVQGTFSTLTNGPWNNPSGDIWHDDINDVDLPTGDYPDYGDPGTIITLNHPINAGLYLTQHIFAAALIIEPLAAFQISNTQGDPFTITGDWTISGDFTNYSVPHISIINIESSSFIITNSGQMINAGNLNHISGTLEINGIMEIGDPSP